MSKVAWKNTINLAKKTRAVDSGIDFKDVFLRITPDKNDGSESLNTLRFLDIPTAYLVHWPNKKGEAGKLERCEFPDKEENRKPTRICHGTISTTGKTVENKDCPWCQMGYSRQIRYMVNVISREHGKIMILDCPPDVIKEVYEWVETAEADGLDNTNPSSWDEPSPDFRVKATRQRGGSIEWRTTATSKHRKLSDDDIELIKAINPKAETDEEALKLYPIDLFTRPSLLGGGVGEAPTKEEEDEDEVVAPPRAASSKASAPAIAKGKNPYKDSDDDDEETEDEDEEDIAPINVKSKPASKPAAKPAEKATAKPAAKKAPVVVEEEEEDDEDAETSDDDDDWDDD